MCGDKAVYGVLQPLNNWLIIYMLTACTRKIHDGVGGGGGVKIIETNFCYPMQTNLLLG